MGKDIFSHKVWILFHFMFKILADIFLRKYVSVTYIRRIRPFGKSFFFCEFNFHYFKPKREARNFCSEKWLKINLTLSENYSTTEFFLVCIFPHLNWIRENTDQEKLRIWTLFTRVTVRYGKLWNFHFAKVLPKNYQNQFCFLGKLVFKMVTICMVIWINYIFL